jgi:hypothetical protein
MILRPGWSAASLYSAPTVPFLRVMEQPATEVCAQQCKLKSNTSKHIGPGAACSIASTPAEFGYFTPDLPAVDRLGVN